jgi:hypothetical protein
MSVFMLQAEVQRDGGAVLEKWMVEAPCAAVAAMMCDETDDRRLLQVTWVGEIVERYFDKYPNGHIDEAAAKMYERAMECGTPAEFAAWIHGVHQGRRMPENDEAKP